MHRLAHLVAASLLTLSTLTAATALAQEKVEAEPEDSDSSSDDEEKRKKRLARLGSGRVNHPEPIGEVFAVDALADRAMEVHPLLVAQESKRFFAEMRKNEADWAFFPKFEVTSALTVVPNAPDPDAVNNAGSAFQQYIELDIGPLSTTSLRVLLPIYTFGKVSTARDLAQLGIDQADLEMKKERVKIAAQIREAYYGLQLGKMIMAIMNDGREVIKDEIAAQNEAREFGDEDVDVVELRKLQIFDAELDARMVDTERLVKLTRKALAILVQMEPDAFDVPRFDEDIDPNEFPDLETCQRLTRENRPDIVLLNKAVAARQLQVDLAESNFYPDVFAAFDLSYSYSTADPPFQTGTTAAGEEIELAPLFDPYNFTRFGFILGLRLKIDPANRYWKMEQAEAQLAETRALQDAALKGIELAVEKRWTETQDLLSKVQIHERRLKAAERWRNQVGIAFQSGGAELKDMIDPLKAFYEARLLLLQARYEYRVSMAKLSQEAGVEDLEAIVSNLNPESPEGDAGE